MPIYTIPRQIGAELVRQFRKRVPTQKMQFPINTLMPPFTSVAFLEYTFKNLKIILTSRGDQMEIIKSISIRGRMAYLLCSFEELLLYYGCNKDEWRLILEKLWKYTNIKYLDDWMYEIAEYMPESILNDTMEDAEYITKDEFEYLYKIYNKCNQEIKCFIKKYMNVELVSYILDYVIVVLTH